MAEINTDLVSVTKASMLKSSKKHEFLVHYNSMH